MIPGVIESDICLLPMVTDWALTLIRLHAHYRNHLLFCEGGLMDQPNVYLEAMELIEGYNASGE